MRWIVLSLLVCLSWPLSGYASIQSGADKLINQVDPAINIGIEVVDLTTGATLYQRNQNRSFIPASNMKLFSNAAALMVLGPDYRFTNYLSAGNVQLAANRLQGNLYLHLAGDPSFSHARLANLLASLKRYHINHIQGDIIVDSSHTAINPYAPGWMVEDLAYSYGAPLAPVMVDANRMTVTVNPAAKAGQSAEIEVADESHTVILTNQVTTKEHNTHCGIDFAMDRNNQLTVKGCVGQGQWAVQQKMAVKNPLLYLQGLIKQQLNKNNVVLDGNIILGKAPSGTMMLARDVSSPIAQLLAETLKPSDNLYADSLFLHAAYKLQGTPVNWREAEVLIKKYLQEQSGIDFQNAVMTDGSGLSRYDLITPAQTTGLLRFLFAKFPVTYEYIAALPVSGRDGTLQKRFRKPRQQDLIRAKTGTMTGIVSLSGYLTTLNTHTLAFAIYINNLPGTSPKVSGRYRYLIDALSNYFLQQKPGKNAWTKLASSESRMRYQQNPTQAEQQRGRQARWRRLETVVKKALQAQAVTIIYRNNELILKDKQEDAARVMLALQELRKKYPFTVALAAKSLPVTAANPLLMRIESNKIPGDLQRIWTIKEAIV